MSLPRALDAEFKRVAKEEDIKMEHLVQEVSDLTGYSTRQIYNFRSGKWSVPSDIIPKLCSRFKSHLLINLLRKQIEEESITPGTGSHNIDELSIAVLKEVTDHHFQIIAAVRKGLDKTKLNELDEATDRVIRREMELFAALEAEYERGRQEERKKA